MAKVLFTISKEQCEHRGWWWRSNACYTTEDPADDWKTYGSAGFTEEIPSEWFFTGAANELIKHGSGIVEQWSNLAYEEPPEDLIGRILWSLGVFSQIIISLFTFPAGLACFMLEESVQSYGMGSYMLYTAGEYELLQDYLAGQRAFIDASEIGVTNLATLSPIIGGAVLYYMEAAKMSTAAFKSATEAQLAKQAEKDEKARDDELDRMNYGELRLTSTPNGAEIWINGENTELLTPETLKKLPVGPTVFEVAKFNKKTEEWDVFVFTLDMEAGRRKEIYIRIPPGISGDIDLPPGEEVPDKPILPLWIAAEVEGEYAIDGDTFITSKNERIRILGIDAPELGRPFAEEAKTFLTEQIEDKKLDLRIMSTKPLDVYGRTLATVKNYKGNVAILLLSDGLARVDIFEDSPLDRTRYDTAEATAKTRKVGIWKELP